MAASYIYDIHEQRVGKTMTDAYGNVTDTHYHYDGEGRLIAETDAATGQFIREYVWLGLTPIATYGENPNPGGGGGPTVLHYLHADHLGRPAFATDVAGQMVWDGGITTPFGLQVSSLGAVTQALMFPGQYADEETGYFDNWHRTYDPTLGRYLQSDPIGLAGGLNRYAYVGGNPVGHVDPKGLQATAFPPGAALEEAGGVSRMSISNGMRRRHPYAVCAGVAGAVGAYSYAVYLERVNPLSNIESMPIAATQTCPDWQKDQLQEIKDNACNRKRKCNSQMLPVEIQTRIVRNQECILARTRQMNICFGGGDQRHGREVIKAQKTLLRCLAQQ